MFVSTLILLIPFLTVAMLPLTLKSFSSHELDQMGVRLESSETPSVPTPGSNCILPSLTVFIILSTWPAINSPPDRGVYYF